MAGAYRIEKDVMGSVRIPAGAYYGVETARALHSFDISGVKVAEEFIKAYVGLKRCAAMVNMRSGGLSKARGTAIVRACDSILQGKMREQFVVDVFQAGAGTNTNMNVNEVVANKALEYMHKHKGEYGALHPNDHVNMSQSTNDTFHSVTHIAAYIGVSKRLLPAMRSLHGTLERKARDFSNIVKVGRTHLQDAVPMMLGDEFHGYADAVLKEAKRVENAAEMLLSIPIGGTAIGTGINAGTTYGRDMVKELSGYFGMGLRRSRNMYGSMQNQLSELACADALKETAVALGKIANDLRVLGSGPRGGIGELRLPPVLPGSSIMPAKVNPSVCEMLNMVCFQVMGCNTTITEAAAGGQLELNVFMPVIAFNLLFSIRILANAVGTFDKRCVAGIDANTRQIRRYLEGDISIATALTPYIGYAKAAEIARKAYMRDTTVMRVCLEEGIMDEKRLRRILDPKRQVR